MTCLASCCAHCIALPCVVLPCVAAPRRAIGHATPVAPCHAMPASEAHCCCAIPWSAIRDRLVDRRARLATHPPLPPRRPRRDWWRVEYPVLRAREPRARSRSRFWGRAARLPAAHPHLPSAAPPHPAQRSQIHPVQPSPAQSAQPSQTQSSPAQPCFSEMVHL